MLSFINRTRQMYVLESILTYHIYPSYDKLFNFLMTFPNKQSFLLSIDFQRVFEGTTDAK